MATSIPIAVRSSVGISIASGPPDYKPVEEFTPIVSKSCRTILFSPDGKYFAFVTGHELRIVQTDTWQDVAVITDTKAYNLSFSPKGTYLASWESFITNKDNPQGTPNLNIYNTADGTLVKSFVHKKQSNWEPQWSPDEQLFSRLNNTDIVFYEGLNFEKIVHRLNCYKVESYSLTPITGTYHVICHTPGGKGQPAFGRMFKYPNFEATQAIANKSFFQADKVDIFWNSKNNCALLLTSTEVDKTGGSYYGKQGLHFMSTTGQTSLVTFSKEGPIHSVVWSPKGQEFCVIYGFMPAKSTIFNLKCEPVFELGTGPRNSIYYNPHGNLLLLGGFGNLRGQIETWDVTNRKLVGKCEAPETTMLQWAPDGLHYLTATTAPRLRIGNGYKIWHYSGSLLYDRAWVQQGELYDACWQNRSKGSFKEPTISLEKVEGIASVQPQASKQAYRPPSARNRPAVLFNLHDDEPHKPGDNPKPSKMALKQRKKREAKKARKLDEGEDGEPIAEAPVVSDFQVVPTGDAEKDKKQKNIKKKLDAIAKLKELQATGKKLEINQLAKMKIEHQLIKELEELQL